MKANETPKKLYIENRKILYSCLTAYTNKRYDDDIEYIRTEAFIKKACKWLKDNGSHHIDIVNGQLVLKKSIIKDFKKYMKGE